MWTNHVHNSCKPALKHKMAPCSAIQLCGSPRIPNWFKIMFFPVAVTILPIVITIYIHTYTLYIQLLSPPTAGFSLTSQTSHSGIHCHQLDSYDMWVVLKCLGAFSPLKHYSKATGSSVSVTSLNCHQSTHFIISSSAAAPSWHCCKGPIWRAATCDKQPTSLWWKLWIN